MVYNYEVLSILGLAIKSPLLVRIAYLFPIFYVGSSYWKDATASVVLLDCYSLNSRIKSY